MLPDMEELTQDDKGAAARSSDGAAGRTASGRRRLYVMRAGARRFAVHADEVEATSENLMPTPLPFAPAPVRGLVSQRGRVLTVIDPLPLLPPAAPSIDANDGAPTTAPPLATPVAPSLTQRPRATLIVALRGDEQLALAVERVESDLELFDDDEPDTTATGVTPRSQLLRRTIRHHAGDIPLLDTAHLFEAAMQGVERRRKRQ